MSGSTRLVLSALLFLTLVMGAAAKEKTKDKVPASRRAPLSIPVRNMPLAPAGGFDHEVRNHVLPVPKRLLTNAPQPVGDAAAQTQFGPNAPTVQGQNTDGIGDGVSGFNVNVAPPDTDGEIGRTQFVQVVNSAFSVFDKVTGAQLSGPTATSSLWSTLPATNPCNSTNDGDGVVIYDQLADRWVISQFANANSATGPFYQCVAVSKTADATGQYFLFFFSYTNFNDYPKLGMWPDAYYISYNAFTAAGAGVGGMVCALDRTNMLDGVLPRGQAGPSGAGGLPAGNGQVCFAIQDFGLLPSDLDGSTPPPPGSTNYFLEWYDTAHLGLWRFHADFSTLTSSTLNGVSWVSPLGPSPASISPVLISVTSFTPTCNYISTGSITCVPQSGTTQKLDTLTDRLMYRLAYRNFGSHESLVVNHNVVAGSSSGVRWYELQNPAGTPIVAQTGTWAPDSNWRWLGSAAMDKFGNLAVGYSVSSSLMHPAIAYAARLAGDTPGTLGNEVTLFTGGGSQTNVGGGLSRWGDYSALSVDPVDDCTFWVTNEYIPANGNFNWRTRFGSFTLPQCQSKPSNISVTPNSGAGASQTFTFLYADTGGASLITTASGLFNATNTLTNGCAFQHNRAANTIQIYQDNGTLNPTAIVVGNSGTLTNSQCSINVGNSSSGSAGNSLVVNVAVTFTTPAFNGGKNIYMNVSDSNGTATGWQSFGTWTVQ